MTWMGITWCRSLMLTMVVLPLSATFQIIIYDSPTVLSLSMSIRVQSKVCLCSICFSALNLKWIHNLIASESLLTLCSHSDSLNWIPFDFILSSVSVISHLQWYYDTRSLETCLLCSRTFIFIISDLVARSCILFSSFPTLSHSILIHFTGTWAPWKFFFIIGNCCGCVV